nr:MAG TPA: hypothetical protein [Caudoviricetes sp.]
MVQVQVLNTTLCIWHDPYRSTALCGTYKCNFYCYLY